MSGRTNNNSTEDRGRGRGRGRGGRRRGKGGGRGSGRGRSQSETDANSNRSRGAPNNSSKTASKQSTPKLQNGEKGAEAHTVAETDRIRLTKLLMDLREGSQQRMEFPPTLTNTERKFVHQLAGQLGLVSKSTGKGEQRRIAVTKRSETKQKSNLDEIPVLRLGQKGLNALKRHMQRHPPTHMEDLESHETGAALVEALNQATGENQNVMIEQTLQELGGLGHDKEAPKLERRVKTIDLERRKRQHEQIQKRKQASKDYHKMQENVRAKLPASVQEETIVETVASNQVTIVQGETGSGKSTQVPQFLLDANPTCSIVCTQPRRISAMSIAERVHQEQCNGQVEVGGMIGYQVRLEAKASRDTQLIFLTPGILLRKLSSDPFLTEYTHIIIDEIHEKDKYTEFLLITLKDLLPQRPELRLILMSATLQTNVLVEYFSTAAAPPALVEVEGRTFPVQAFYLEDILKMTRYVDDGGDGTQQNQQLVCKKCGKTDFPDAIEFGIHEVLCDGGGGNEEDIDPAISFLDPGMTNDHDPQEGGFEEYNVDEPMRLELDDSDDDAGDEPLLNVQPTDDSQEEKEEADAVDDIKKWDGTSPFEAVNQYATTDLDATDEELLNRYQAMHDDEQVDMYLLLEVLHYILKSSHGDGAILVFLPGWQEISEFSLLLENTPPFRNKSKFLILPLHSGIPSKDQRKVLRRPPSGVRKIVLSTNIAETSLTIEDVAFVLDSGRAKEKDYDPHLKTSTLQPTWISQASCKQRRGRAGRTKAGVCFHLFSSRRHESMRPFTESELLRTPLEEMCLMCKKLDLAPGGPEDEDGVPAFLAKAMTPPHPKSVGNALSLLVDLGAMLPETNDLTHLGQCLATLSLEPRVGKMVIWSYLLGCARAASNMAVAMSYKSPFILPPPNMRRTADTAKVRLSQNSESDQITVLHALQKRDALIKRGPGAWDSFCRENFLGVSTMQMIADLRKNLTRELTSLGFPAPSSSSFHNRHDKDEALWQAAVAAGVYPNVASRSTGEVNFKTMTNQKSKIHVSSVNAVKGQPLNSKCDVPQGEIEFVCFGEMVKGSFFFTLNQTTHLASPLPLLLLCGTSLSVMPRSDDTSKAVLNVDDWIIFQCDAELAAHLVIFRKRLESAFWRTVSRPHELVKNAQNKSNGLTEVERDAIEILGTVLQSAHRSTNVR